MSIIEQLIDFTALNRHHQHHGVESIPAALPPITAVRGVDERRRQALHSCLLVSTETLMEQADSVRHRRFLNPDSTSFLQETNTLQEISPALSCF